MKERQNRIPPIVERSDGIERAMPLTLFDGSSTESILKREKGLILPQNSKVVFEIGFGDENNGVQYFDLGPIRLNRDFEGFYIGPHYSTYTSMPKDSSTVAFIPESEERRQKVRTIVELKQSTLDLSDPNRGEKARKKFDNKAINIAELHKLDRTLQKNFLRERQEDVEFFNIDPDTVSHVRIRAAIDKKTMNVQQLII